MKNINFKTFAKVNLGLSILGKLANNYHQVETVMTKIPLGDELFLEWRDDKKIEIICEHELVPNNSNNLIYRAFFLLQQDFNLPNARFVLHKNVRVGAGLGGGSFNAGGLLKMLNQKLDLKISDFQMQKYALQLGADVPLAASNFNCVLEKNHGLDNLEQQQLPCLPSCQLALIYQNYQLSTSEMYDQIDHLKLPMTSQSSLVTAIEKKSLIEIAKNLNNDFEKFLFIKDNKLLGIKNQLLGMGALGVNVTGKGPTLMALFRPNDEAAAKLINHNFDFDLLQINENFTDTN